MRLRYIKILYNKHGVNILISPQHVYFSQDSNNTIFFSLGKNRRVTMPYLVIELFVIKICCISRKLRSGSVGIYNINIYTHIN